MMRLKQSKYCQTVYTLVKTKFNSSYSLESGVDEFQSV